MLWVAPSSDCRGGMLMYLDSVSAFKCRCDCVLVVELLG